MKITLNQGAHALSFETTQNTDAIFLRLEETDTGKSVQTFIKPSELCFLRDTIRALATDVAAKQFPGDIEKQAAYIATIYGEPYRDAILRTLQVEKQIEEASQIVG